MQARYGLHHTETAAGSNDAPDSVASTWVCREPQRW